MSAPKAPRAPDPAETAAAQTGSNVITALSNAQIGNVNQYGPNGNVTYGTEGSRSFTDPTNGATYDIPQYTQTTTLSSEQQAIADQNNEASLNLASLGNNLSSTLGDRLEGNFTIGNEETEARLFDLGSNRLRPELDRGRAALETRLANQGIGLNTEAYSRAMNGFDQKENDAFNQLALTGRSQAVQEQFAEDNQRINQIGALMSGGQVSMPTFAAGVGNQPQLPTVDYAGLVNQNYQNELGQYNQQAQANQQLWGGALGAGASLLSLSDERAKNKMTPVGEMNGHSLYEYSYKGDGKNRHIGVSAQETEKKRPDAVHMGADGLRRVDYGALFNAGGRR